MQSDRAAPLPHFHTCHGKALKRDQVCTFRSGIDFRGIGLIGLTCVSPLFQEDLDLVSTFGWAIHTFCFAPFVLPLV